MGFWDHVEELRRQFFKALIGIALFFAIALFFQNELMLFVLRPYFQGIDMARDGLRDDGIDPRQVELLLPAKIYVTSPIERFFQFMKVAFIASMIVSVPWTIWCVWAFIRAGLHPYERKTAERYMPLSMLLALCGLALGYFVMVPLVLQQLLLYGQPDPDSAVQIENIITLDKYLSFFLILTFVQAMAFQLPIVMYALTIAGIIEPGAYQRKRRHAILGLAIAAMLVTPPDLPSMIALLVPLLGLYEIGAWSARLAWKKRLARQAEDHAQYGDLTLADALVENADELAARARVQPAEIAKNLGADSLGQNSPRNDPSQEKMARETAPRERDAPPSTPPTPPQNAAPDSPDDEAPLDWDAIYSVDSAPRVPPHSDDAMPSPSSTSAAGADEARREEQMPTHEALEGSHRREYAADAPAPDTLTHEEPIFFDVQGHPVDFSHPALRRIIFRLVDERLQQRDADSPPER